jgi:hypothetical protein
VITPMVALSRHEQLCLILSGPSPILAGSDLVNEYHDEAGHHPIGGHEAYMAAMEQEDAKLEQAITDIVRRTDAGELTVREAALERVAVLEAHLEACQRLRRQHLGGS